MAKDDRAKQHRCKHHIQFQLVDGDLTCDPCGEVIKCCEECEADLEANGDYWIVCTDKECGNTGDGKGYRLFIGVSPSQTKVFRECKRKWAYGYIDRIKIPSKPAQQFGIEGHARNEAWLRDGTPLGDDDVGKVCSQGVKPNHLPTPAPDLLVEHYFEIPLFDGASVMLGYIDCVKPTRPGDPLPIIHDWKFTKDLRWAMTADELDDDSQAAVYAKVGIEMYPEAEEIMDRWVYFCGRVNKKSDDGRPRTPRGVRAVEQTYNRDQIECMWQTVVEDAAEIVELKRTVKEAKDVEPNQLHCDAYGGCDHREYCPLPESVGLGAAMEQWEKTHNRRKSLTQNINEGKSPSTKEQQMSEDNAPEQELLEQLRGLKGNTKKAEPEAEAKAAPAEPEEEAATPATGDQGDLLADLQAQHGAGEAVNPPADKPKKKNGGLASLQAMVDGGETGPEGQSSKDGAEDTAKELAAEDKGGDGALAQLKNMGKKLLGVGQGAEKPVEPKAETKAEPPTEPKPDKPKRGRKPKKSKELPSPSKVPVGHDSEGNIIYEDVVIAKAGTAFILAINSAVSAKNGALGDITELTDFLEPIAKAVATSHRCKEHPEGVDHFDLIEFGNGKAELAAATARYLDKNPFSGVLVVDGMSAEGNAVKDVLIRRADVVIRGVR